MNINLKPEQEALIQAKLQSGQYQTVDDVIQAALHLLDEHDKADEQWVIDTRDKVNAAAASLDRGEGLDGETFVNQLVVKLKQAREAQT